MTLTLILDPAPVGVRASLIEEWEELGRTARMEPMVRLFESREQAIVWARAFASRRGSKQIISARAACAGDCAWPWERSAATNP